MPFSTATISPALIGATVEPRSHTGGSTAWAMWPIAFNASTTFAILYVVGSNGTSSGGSPLLLAFRNVASSSHRHSSEATRRSSSSGQWSPE